MQNNPLGVLVLIVLGLLAVVGSQSFTTVDAGNVGIVKRFGAVQEGVLQPGLHLKLPIVTEIVEVETRIKRVEADAIASSKDLQVVTSKIVLNYRVDRDQADQLYEQLGIEYPKRIVEPALQESIKATTSQYTAEELITNRKKVAEGMLEDIKHRLESKFLLPTDLSIIDFQFSDVFNDAIEQKQVAQQAALRASNELEKIRIEADQAKVEAGGLAEAELERARAESEAQKMLRDTISPEVLQLRFIERWDGKLPIYSGGDLPTMLMPAPVPQ